jgi:hypothetical protein
VPARRSYRRQGGDERQHVNARERRVHLVLGSSVNITLMSYDGTCDIGINIDTAAVRDPDVLLDGFRESFAEITALGDGPEARPCLRDRAHPRDVTI